LHAGLEGRDLADGVAMSALEEVRDDPTSRKKFLKMAGGSGAASALALLVAACGGDDESAGGSTGERAADAGAKGSAEDLKIVNYALTLEYLEADFYQQVIDSGAIKDAKVASLAKSFGEAEQAHVDALTQTVKSLGGTPAAKPQTRFGEIIDGGATKILTTAATVENLGAAAYLGQAGRIKDKKILAAALSIHSVEARHAAALNELVGRGFKGSGRLEGSLPDGAFAKPMSMAQVLKQVQPFIAG
jgi:rubrerythrin